MDQFWQGVIGNIIGAAVGAGLTVMISLWLMRRERKQERREERRRMLIPLKLATEELEESVANSDDPAGLAWRVAFERFRPRFAAVMAQALDGRISDLSLSRAITAEQGNWHVTCDFFDRWQQGQSDNGPYFRQAKELAINLRAIIDTPET